MTKEFSIAQEISIAQVAAAPAPAVYFSSALDELMSSTNGMRRDWRSFNMSIEYSPESDNLVFRAYIEVDKS